MKYKKEKELIQTGILGWDDICAKVGGTLEKCRTV